MNCAIKTRSTVIANIIFQWVVRVGPVIERDTIFLLMFDTLVHSYLVSAIYNYGYALKLPGQHQNQYQITKSTSEAMPDDQV